MSFPRRNRGNQQLDIWPGFVDALSTVLLVFIFVLVGFIASQVYLSNIIFDKDSSISNMRTRLHDVCQLLDSEKEKNTELLNKISELNSAIQTLEGMFTKVEKQRKEEHDSKLSLKEQVSQLTEQLKDVMAALAAEHKSVQEQKEALALIKKKNIKLNELAKFSAYRSDFFDKMRSVVKGKDGIKISGDRFIVQSELFFDSGSADLRNDGKEQLSKLADVVKEISKKIPPKINWILRVDGHTDSRPISSSKFNSNWELSAARAISVVKFLSEEGVNPKNLVAAGFGEHQPISSADTNEEFAKNRRIEFKLDER